MRPFDPSYDPRGAKDLVALGGQTALVAVLLTLVRVGLNRTLFAYAWEAFMPASATAARRRAAKKERPSAPFNKWTESCWRLVCYSVSVVTGLYLVGRMDVSLTSVDAVWDDAGRFEYSELAKAYMIASLGFYTHLLLLQFLEERKKDFWPMVVHHIVTLVLIFMCNFYYLVPVGILIMTLHDVADPLLEFGKLCKYSGRQKAADAIFALFAAVFGYSRLWFFPYHVIYSTHVHSGPLFPYSRLSVILLSCLCVLHTYWFSFIVKIAVGFVTTGKVEDARSDSDIDTDAAPSPAGAASVDAKPARRAAAAAKTE